MTTPQQILEILTARKVFDGQKWRAVDADGNDLVDSGGVLWRGVHGALLWVSATWGIGGSGWLPILRRRRR